jgi:hypothetical protein
MSGTFSFVERRGLKSILSVGEASDRFLKYDSVVALKRLCVVVVAYPDFFGDSVAIGKCFAGLLE